MGGEEEKKKITFNIFEEKKRVPLPILGCLQR